MQDPRNYFKFAGCAGCLDKPCDRLRFGGVFTGKFILVHNANLGAGLFDCPFVAREANEIDWLLGQVAPEELSDHLDAVLQRCAPDELMQIQERFSGSGALGREAAAVLIRDLWENQIVGVIRIPQFFHKNAVIRKWLFAFGQGDERQKT
jgi:hypothetical protein